MSDSDGVPVGRIEDVRTGWEGDHCMVTEIRIGPTSSERVAASPTREVLCVKWADLDLTDPRAPRLRTTLAALRRGAA